jgi:hypothetical protein
MAHFSFQSSTAQRLGSLSLMVGEEARPIILKSDAPDDPVLTSILLDDNSLVVVEEAGSSHSSSGSYRVYRVVGRKAGSGTLQAFDVPRQGPSKTLDTLNVTVSADTSNTDLIYTGKWLVWVRALPAQLSTNAPHFFAATSGLLGHQVAREKCNENHGPLPEGTYSLLAAIDKQQANVQMANAMGEQSISNRRDGIQFLRIGGNGPVDAPWGTMRVQLNPVKGDMCKRSGFYLHNSHKGFSHGCIEVGASTTGADFFTALQGYVMEAGHYSQLTVRVKYSFPEQTTVGATYRPPAPLPTP